MPPRSVEPHPHLLTQS